MAQEILTSSTSDGQINSSNATYATAQSASSGTVANESIATFVTGNEFTAGVYVVRRGFIYFDLTNVSGVVTSVSLSLTVTSKDTTVDDNLQVVSSTANDPLQSGDFDLVGSTGFIDSPPAFSSLSLNTPFDLDFNSAGISAIEASRGGSIVLGLRAVKDISATSPGSNRSYVILGAAENTTENYRPILTVNYISSSGYFFAM